MRVLALRRLCRYLEQFGVSKPELPKMKRPEARSVTAKPEEIAGLLRLAPPHLRLFTLLCWQTALRYTEAFSVTPHNWNRETGTVSVMTKGRKNRIIPVTPEITALLELAAERGEPHQSAVISLYGKPIGTNGLRRQWIALAAKANANIRPHDLRRTTATALYAVSKDLRAVQQYLGHDSMASTVQYLAPLTPDKLRQYHQLLNFDKFHSEVKQ